MEASLMPSISLNSASHDARAQTREFSRREALALGLGAAAAASLPISAKAAEESRFRVTLFEARGIKGSRDVTPASNGDIWVCGQRNGTLGLLTPATGTIRVMSLGEGAAPHGVITGPDGAAWVTEGGQNVIARVEPGASKADLIPLPADKVRANLNTGVFDREGIYWFTGQNGVIGRLDPKSAAMKVWDAPRGRGPYGITRTPGGDIWYVSLAGNHLAKIDRAKWDSAQAPVTIIEPPTPGQGARRVWSDSKGRLWISEWNSGQVSVHDPAQKSWKQWKLPGEKPRAYSVYVDHADIVWLTDFGANAVVRFDPATESFMDFKANREGANIRQMDGREGEVWGGESGLDRIVRIQTVKPA
jgi:virginiamycin B lyase